MYEFARDANFYLEGSIIKYNDTLVVVHSVDDTFNMRCHDLSADREVVTNLREDGGVDLKPIPLGFMNYQGNAYYIARKPKRSWRQGLSRNNVSTELPWELIVSPRLVDVVKGNYPTYKEALELIKDGQGVAFHRNFKLSKMHGATVVNYKNLVVGMVVDGGRIALSDPFTYLRELVMEIVE